MSKTERARVATYDVAGFVIEFLHLPDGSFGIGVSQVAEQFQLLQQNATRDIKRLLGEGSNLFQTKSELAKRAVNYLTLEQFEKVVFELSLKGNLKAQELTRDMIGLSLVQLAHDAFGIKYENEKRLQWMEFRALHKKQYHPLLTYWLKEDGCVEGKDYALKVIEFKRWAGLPSRVSVNEYDKEQLHKLNNAEVVYNAMRKAGMPHGEAIKFIG